MGVISYKGKTPDASRNGQSHCSGDEEFKCSGKSCRSIAGGVIADCVAVCCCPIAVVNIFTLVFVKVPYTMGKMCLGKMKKRKKKSVERENGGELGRKDVESLEKKSWEMGEEEEVNVRYSPRFEAEKVWLELYQLGDLGFGRVSSSHDIHPLDKSNYFLL